jgi:DNA-binding response OmpR family regulator
VPPSPSATILVLEENAAVLELIDQTLREPSDRVLGTQDALEAIELVRRVRIDVVVVGVLVEGQVLVRELRVIQPELRIVSIRDGDIDPPEIESAATLLSPVSLDELREAVAVNIDGR